MILEILEDFGGSGMVLEDFGVSGMVLEDFVDFFGFWSRFWSRFWKILEGDRGRHRET